MRVYIVFWDLFWDSYTGVVWARAQSRMLPDFLQRKKVSFCHSPGKPSGSIPRALRRKNCSLALHLQQLNLLNEAPFHN